MPAVLRRSDKNSVRSCSPARCFYLVCAASCRLSDPVGVKLGVEADDELVFDPIGRRAQIATGADHLLQNRFFLGRDLLKALKLFPLGDGHRPGLLQQQPGRVSINPGRACIDNFCAGNLFFLKKLLSIVTGCSTFAQVCPIDLHACLLYC